MSNECFDNCWPGISDEPVAVTTKCKHGKGNCKKCGTTNKRDKLHTTESGVGKIGKLLKK